MLPSMLPTVSSVFVSLVLAGHALGAKFSQSAISQSIGAASFGNTVPNKFIVEVADAGDIPGKRSLDSRTVCLNSFFHTAGQSHANGSLQTHEQLYDFMRKRDLGFTVEKEFNSPGLFVGSVVTLSVGYTCLSRSSPLLTCILAYRMVT